MRYGSRPDPSGPGSKGGADGSAFTMIERANVATWISRSPKSATSKPSGCPTPPARASDPSSR